MCRNLSDDSQELIYLVPSVFCLLSSVFYFSVCGQRIMLRA